MLLLVRCPECKNEMKCKPRVNHISDIKDKSKRCVYCGRSFKLHSSPKKSNIVKQLS